MLFMDMVGHFIVTHASISRTQGEDKTGLKGSINRTQREYKQDSKGV